MANAPRPIGRLETARATAPIASGTPPDPHGSKPTLTSRPADWVDFGVWPNVPIQELALAWWSNEDAGPQHRSIAASRPRRGHMAGSALNEQLTPLESWHRQGRLRIFRAYPRVVRSSRAAERPWRAVTQRKCTTNKPSSTISVRSISFPTRLSRDRTISSLNRGAAFSTKPSETLHKYSRPRDFMHMTSDLLGDQPRWNPIVTHSGCQHGLGSSGWKSRTFTSWHQLCS